MKAIVLTKTGSAKKAFEMREMPTPTFKEDEVLIKVAYSGLNFADVMARKGMYKDAPPLPSILGYDISGMVEAVGNKVTQYKPGDAVFGLSRFGGYAQYVVCNELAIAKVPNNIEMAAATALATQFSTAWFCAADMVNLYPGDTALIHAAAGGVGTALVQYVLHKKCIVFATAGSQEKIDLLMKAGVNTAINYRKENFSKIIKEKTNGKGVNVIFDAVGGKTTRLGMKSLSAGGRLVCFGASELTSSASPFHQLKTVLAFGFYHPGLLAISSKSILGVNMLHISDALPHVIKRCLDNVNELVDMGVFKPVLGKVFPAADIADAHIFLESRASIGKVVLEW